MRNKMRVIVSSTVDKALDLLNQFSQAHAQIGLSELARLAALDKATVHRMLTVLAKHGFVEQDEQTKLYRLGAGLLRLARSREASFPISSVIDAELQALVQQTGETAHASLIAGGSLATVGIVHGTKAIRVTLEADQSLPFHATASGIACLAFLPGDKMNTIMKRKLASFTSATPTSPDEILAAVSAARNKGFALSDQSYEADVFGIAAPLFSASGYACGAVAVATPAHRMTREVKQRTIAAVMDAAVLMTRRMGAEPPRSFVNLLLKTAA
jgi:IclR family transcriptional regulator, acetate operon repressor